MLIFFMETDGNIVPETDTRPPPLPPSMEPAWEVLFALPLLTEKGPRERWAEGHKSTYRGSEAGKTQLPKPRLIHQLMFFMKTLVIGFRTSPNPGRFYLEVPTLDTA